MFSTIVSKILPDMIVLEFLPCRYNVLQQTVHVFLELLFRRLFHHVKEHDSIIAVNQSVIKHAIHLVDPQSDQLISLLKVRGGNEEHAKHDTREVTQVKHVVRLARSREEFLHHRLVHVHRGLDKNL